MDAKIVKLREVFETMSYGENMEDTTEGQKWLQSANITDKSVDNVNIQDIVYKIKDTINKYVIERPHLLKLARELKNNAAIICQIEIVSRGILSKDTRKAVEILADYFSFYASIANMDNPGNNQEVAVGVFEDDHPLWLLGLFLAPALASNQRVIIHTGTTFAPVVAYVVELAVKSGITIITHISSYEDDLQPQVDISTAALFVDLSKEKYKAIISNSKKILILSGYKTPILVFDDADLDSAVECVIDAAWGYQGILPWSADTVLIQENVFDKFKEKLKTKVQAIKIGSGADKLADIAYPNNPNVVQTLTETVTKAKALGIEVFQKEDVVKGNFTPTLIIGSKVYTNNVLSSPKNDGTITLLPFRSIEEAVNLANNSRQGLGASIWSENIGLVNEVARKLMVSNVWINSFGLFSVDLPLVPLKDSGWGYFGGPEGILDYVYYRPLLDIYILRDAASENFPEINNAIVSSKNASIAWNKVSSLDKIKYFTNLYVFLEDKEKELGGQGKIDENRVKFSFVALQPSQI